MGNRVRLAAYGLLIWLIPFVVAMALYTVRESWRSLFESAMAVVLASAVTAFAYDHLRRLSAAGAGTGLAVGLVWMAISIAIDLPLMLPAPIAMPVGEYFADIGLTYVMIPVIAAGIGAALARRDRKAIG